MIICRHCHNKKPLGEEGAGPAYAFDSFYLCEKHWTRAEKPERVKLVRGSEYELKRFKVKQKKDAIPSPY